MDSRRPPCATVFLILTVLEPSTASARADQPIAALAPVETVLEGRDELIGVAVTADGTLYVSDRGAGIVYRLPTSGALGPAASGLDPTAGPGPSPLACGGEQASCASPVRWSPRPGCSRANPTPRARS